MSERTDATRPGSRLVQRQTQVRSGMTRSHAPMSADVGTPPVNGASSASRQAVASQVSHPAADNDHDLILDASSARIITNTTSYSSKLPDTERERVRGAADSMAPGYSGPRQRHLTQVLKHQGRTAGMTSLADEFQPMIERIAEIRASHLESTPPATIAQDPASSASGTTAASPGRSTRQTYSAQREGSCSVCHDVGYLRVDLPVTDPSFGKPIPCECRVREWDEQRRQDLRRISSLDPFKDKTFESFNQRVVGVCEAYDVARSYAAEPTGWLVLRGSYGCGKTHLAAAIANAALASGEHVFFSIVPDLLDHLRAAFAPSSELGYDELFERVREAGLLVLDDLGAENGTAWASEKLFQIINYRYNLRMPTVITTNNRLVSHMDERLASRLSDIGLVRTIAIDAQDYRRRNTGAASRAHESPKDMRLLPKGQPHALSHPPSPQVSHARSVISTRDESADTVGGRGAPGGSTRWQA